MSSRYFAYTNQFEASGIERKRSQHAEKACVENKVANQPERVGVRTFPTHRVLCCHCRNAGLPTGAALS